MSSRHESRALSPPSPLSRPLDLVLHIGSGKAGSTSIQFFLRDNRERLKQLGVLYPKSPGQARHSQLSLFVKSPDELQTAPEWPRQRQSDPAAFRKAFRRRLFSEIERSGLSRVLLSDEVLFGSSASALRRLRRFTDRIADNLRVVVYLRRQDDHMVSRYQQGVKIGRVVRLVEWVREDMSELYDYHTRLRTWERLVEPRVFVVRRFEPDRFMAGSLYQDFLHAAGLDAHSEDWVQGPTRNESLDAESVEFLRLWNIYLVEHEAEIPGLIDNRRLTRRLAATSTGPSLTLPPSLLEQFMAKWEKSNRLVAREFLGDESGELFLGAPKSHHTTTTQLLDPARIGHFLDLLELPERVHDPLRRLAEREAAAARGQ